MMTPMTQHLPDALLAALAVLAVLLSPDAAAQDRGDDPWRGGLSIAGSYNAGNLDQMQLMARGNLSYSGEKAGNDLIVNGFRFWLKYDDAEPFTRLGDDLAVTEAPFYYFRPKLYLQGIGRYESSQLHQLDHRVSAGGGVGYTPVRREELLMRASLGVQYEHARYPGDDFRLDVTHDDGSRTVPRVALNSNGWFQVAGSPVGFRYLGYFLVNPLDPKDLRLSLDASAVLTITRVFSAQLTATYGYNAVVLDEVDPQDLRVTTGITLSVPQSG